MREIYIDLLITSVTPTRTFYVHVRQKGVVLQFRLQFNFNLFQLEEAFWGVYSSIWKYCDFRRTSSLRTISPFIYNNFKYIRQWYFHLCRLVIFLPRCVQGPALKIRCNLEKVKVKVYIEVRVLSEIRT